MIRGGCGDEDCGVSTGIVDEELTFGSGELDEHGYWELPCAKCARAYERLNPKAGSCWPFAKTPEAP
jgi:hypothetical protein